MLQPLQLKEVSLRYANEIAELRDFLDKAGLPLDSAQTLPTLAARLRDDRTFRRDLISHVWVVSHAGQHTLSYPDLLGVLAIAAAGQRFAAAADDVDAHDLLRFLMEARRSFDTSADSKKVIPIPIRAVAAEPPTLRAIDPPHPTLLPGPELFTRHSEDADADTDTDTDRRPLIWAGIALCLLLAVLLGILLHHASSANQIAATPTATAASPAIQPTESPAEPATNQPPARVNASRQKSSPHSAASTSSSTDATPFRPTQSSPALTKPATAKPAAGTPASVPTAPAASRSTRAPQNAVAANAVPPRPLRRRTTPPPPPAPGDLSALVPKVRPVTIPSDDEAHDGTFTPSPHSPIVRPTSLGIMAANVTYSPAPPYPPEASAAHVQGEVKVEAEVDPSGNVASARVISGPPLLREAAVDAVEHWRYRPYTAQGKPITMSALIVMDFQLP